jgi:hypothetical protein
MSHGSALKRRKAQFVVPGFRPQAFGVAEWIRFRCVRLKAGLQTDFLRRYRNDWFVLTETDSR